MAYDHELADRIRELMASQEGVTEQQMVDDAAIVSDAQLDAWVTRGVTYARSLPAKTKSKRR